MNHQTITKIEGERFGMERALYGSHGVHLVGCRFDGDEDGESALKESSDILVESTVCNLRYPFWHDRILTIRNSEMTPACRAPLWYSEQILIENSRLHGVKALRECREVTLTDCDIKSPEFGWSSHEISFDRCSIEGEYCMLHAGDITMRDTEFFGKYSFQYIKNATIQDCTLRTKDAFWHAEHVLVKNCTIEGEYLAWYAKDITFDHCVIKGTQPFCYTENLTLIDCEMQDCDLAFEKSSVTASIKTPVISIKNPMSGRITLPALGELILDDPDAHAEVIVTGEG